MDVKNSIIFIGRICSGKSSLSRLVSEATGIAKASFGGYLVKLAPTLDLKIDRESLQDLGQSLIDNDPGKFLTNVIEFSGSPNEMIFEGVRHQIIKDKIEENSKSTISFYIDVQPDVRYKRGVQRGDSNISRDEFLKWDDHIVEREIENLKNTCTHILDGNESLLSLKDQVIGYLNTENKPL